MTPINASTYDAFVYTIRIARITLTIAVVVEGDSTNDDLDATDDFIHSIRITWG